MISTKEKSCDFLLLLGKTVSGCFSNKNQELYDFIAGDKIEMWRKINNFSSKIIQGK